MIDLDEIEALNNVGGAAKYVPELIAELREARRKAADGYRQGFDDHVAQCHAFGLFEAAARASELEEQLANERRWTQEAVDGIRALGKSGELDAITRNLSDRSCQRPTGEIAIDPVHEETAAELALPAVVATQPESDGGER